jgi:hypothetical protein
MTDGRGGGGGGGEQRPPPYSKFGNIFPGDSDGGGFIGFDICFVNGNQDKVTADEGSVWRLDSGRIAKTSTEGTMWWRIVAREKTDAQRAEEQDAAEAASIESRRKRKIAISHLMRRIKEAFLSLTCASSSTAREACRSTSTK